MKQLSFLKFLTYNNQSPRNNFTFLLIFNLYIRIYTQRNQRKIIIFNLKKVSISQVITFLNILGIELLKSRNRQIDFVYIITNVENVESIPFSQCLYVWIFARNLHIIYILFYIPSLSVLFFVYVSIKIYTNLQQQYKYFSFLFTFILKLKYLLYY